MGHDYGLVWPLVCRSTWSLALSGSVLIVMERCEPVCLLSGREGRCWRGGAERHSALIKGKWPQVDPGYSESLNYTCPLQERKKIFTFLSVFFLTHHERSTFVVEWTFLYIVRNVD